MIGKVLIPNFIAMILLLLILFSSNSVSRHVRLLDSRIFEIMVACNFMQCAGEIISFSIDGIPGFNIINLIVNTLLFTTNIFFAYLWVIYAEYKIFEDLERVKTRGKKLALPALFVIVCSLINLFTPVFFKIMADNVYQRTSLYFLPFLVTYFYLAYGTIFIYKHKSQARKYVFLPALLFMFPILLGSLVQFFFYGFSTVWVGVAIGLVAVYVNVQNETSYTDALSGLYSRVYMMQYLENAVRKKDRSGRIAGIMMDIDEFKKINDNYGHLMGDDAIRSAGKLLHMLMNEKSIAARYGGDEFIILMQMEHIQDLDQMQDKFKELEDKFNTESGKPYQLHFSTGTAILEPASDNVDSFLDRMDKAMYQAKRERKLQR